MSEASRLRYLFIKNRLEELLWKHGPPPDGPMPIWLEHSDADPTWGPVGRLAAEWMLSEHIDWLLEMDRDMRRRARTDAEAPGKPVSPPRGPDW